MECTADLDGLGYTEDENGGREVEALQDWTGIRSVSVSPHVFLRCHVSVLRHVGGICVTDDTRV